MYSGPNENQFQLFGLILGKKCNKEIYLYVIVVVVCCQSVQQKDLEQLKERLDQLDDNQRHQLQELRGFQDCVISETGPAVNSSHKD